MKRKEKEKKKLILWLMILWPVKMITKITFMKWINLSVEKKQKNCKNIQIKNCENKWIKTVKINELWKVIKIVITIEPSHQDWIWPKITFSVSTLICTCGQLQKLFYFIGISILGHFRDCHSSYCFSCNGVILPWDLMLNFKLKVIRASENRI